MRWADRPNPRLLQIVVFLVLTSATTAAWSQEEATFEGTYVYAGGNSQRTGFLKAIDHVVDQMNVVVRSIARERISSRVKIQQRIVFRRDSGGLFISHEPLPPRITKLDGTPMRLKNRAGDRISVLYRKVGVAIVETIRSGSSTQTNTYSFAGGGDRLIFTAAIHSPMMPADIRYRLSYQRQNQDGDLLVSR